MNIAWSTIPLTCFVLVVAVYSQEPHPQKPKAKAPGGEASTPFDAFQNFSAKVHGGIRNDSGRQIYRSGDQIRADFEDHYRITDLRSLTMWAVFPKNCSKFAMPDASAFPFSTFHDAKVERHPSNETETIDGHPCNIENVTFQPKDGGPKAVQMRLWEATDLNSFPIKIEIDSNGKKMTIEYKSVNLSPPDKKLFFHPLKCSATTAPGQKGNVVLPAKPPPASPKPKGSQ